MEVGRWLGTEDLEAIVVTEVLRVAVAHNVVLALGSLCTRQQCSDSLHSWGAFVYSVLKTGQTNER